MYEVITNNRIRKMPEMKKPVMSDFTTPPLRGLVGDQYSRWQNAYYKYEAELLKQPTYPISGDHNWKVGDRIPDSQVEIRTIMKNKTIGEYSLNAMGPEPVAVPIASSPTEEDELWYEVQESLYDGVLNTGKHNSESWIQYIKQHFTIQRRKL